MYTDIAQQFDIIQFKQPVGVVDHNSLAFRKIDKACHLFFKAGYVMRDKFRSQHFTHIVFAAGVANHTGPAS